jgi:hypothetical protein
VHSLSLDSKKLMDSSDSVDRGRFLVRDNVDGAIESDL